VIHRRSPAIWVFGVDEHAVQLTWRQLGTAALRLRVLDDGIDRVVEVDAPGDAGAILVDGLPAGRLLRIEATSAALPGPCALAAGYLAPLPGEELCRIATASDLHLGIRGFGHRGTITDPFDHPDPHAVRCARAAFDEAVAWGAQRIVVKGDLTNMGRPTEWRRYAALVDATPVPVDALPGNHDHGPSRLGGHVLPRQAARAFGLSIATPVTVRDLPGLRLVLADTSLAGHHGGTLAEVGPAVLDAAAEADPAGGVLVALHHQLQPHRLPEGWPPGIERTESRAFLDALGRAHPHALVTSGHTHRNRRWGRAGVVVTQVCSTKDYPGAWGGYVVHEGGIRQIVRRTQHPDAIGWTDHTRIAAFGLWEHAAPGRLDARCFNVPWSRHSSGSASLRSSNGSTG
jgi:hypothetical protein